MNHKQLSTITTTKPQTLVVMIIITSKPQFRNTIKPQLQTNLIAMEKKLQMNFIVLRITQQHTITTKL